MRVRINIAKDISAGLNIARIYNPPRGNHAWEISHESMWQIKIWRTVPTENNLLTPPLSLGRSHRRTKWHTSLIFDDVVFIYMKQKKDYPNIFYEIHYYYKKTPFTNRVPTPHADASKAGRRKDNWCASSLLV
jgi:hypothetical protein